MSVTQNVEAVLTDRVLSGKYRDGEKIPSIRELSCELNASYVIVFRAIQNMKRKQYLESRGRTGIFVRRNAECKFRSDAREVAVVFADPARNPREEYQLEVYTHLQSLLRERGYLDLALRFDETSLRCACNPAGAIVFHQSPLLPWFRKNRIPVVYCSSISADEPFSSVSPDFYQGSYAVTEYLIACGHKRIGLVSAADPANRGSFTMRAKGYADAMADHSLESLDELSWSVESTAAKKQLERMFLGKQPPTALFVTNDVMGIEVLHFLQKRGIRIPEDVSIAGLEDMRCSRFSNPPLTTASYDKRVLAEETVVLLESLISGRESGPLNRRIPMSLALRGSVQTIAPCTEE